VRLEPLYRLRLRYRRRWDAEIDGQLHQLLHGEGRCEGEIVGRFEGMNRARRRLDGVFEPDYQGVIETDDGATILWHLTGYGLPDQDRALATVKHVCADERYTRLNDVLCAVNGSVRPDDEGVEIVLDVAELVWEPPPD
jgi:hypothetical protein